PDTNGPHIGDYVRLVQVARRDSLDDLNAFEIVGQILAIADCVDDRQSVRERVRRDSERKRRGRNGQLEPERSEFRDSHSYRLSDSFQNELHGVDRFRTIASMRSNYCDEPVEYSRTSTVLCLLKITRSWHPTRRVAFAEPFLQLADCFGISQDIPRTIGVHP